MTTDVATVRERLREIGQQIRTAAEAVDGDTGASPVLAAVVREFRSKSAKGLEVLGNGAGADTARECVIELEQAGDSAKAAAEADTGASETTRQAVLDAHLAICMFKAGA